MSSKKFVMLCVSAFLAVFVLSALVRINLLGAAPTKLLKVEWEGTMGKDMPYENAFGHSYDLYLPANLAKEKTQYLILFIHGGSFNSGRKEDGDAWCKYYASKGYITATVDYSLQSKGADVSIHTMNREIEAAVKAIRAEVEGRGYSLGGMAPCGVSAGGTLAMNLAYNGNAAIPVKFVFQLAAPTYFTPEDWGLLMRVNGWKTEEAFLSIMTGEETDIDAISPAGVVKKNSPTSLIGYGLKDHCVPLNQKDILISAYEANGVVYDYFAFPNSNHGMYNDLDILQEFIDRSLMYCETYFTE